MTGVALAFFVLWTAMLWWCVCRVDAQLRRDCRLREVRYLHDVRRAL